MAFTFMPFTSNPLAGPDRLGELFQPVTGAVDNREGVLKQGMPVEAEIPLQ